MDVVEKRSDLSRRDSPGHPMRRASDSLPPYSVIVPCYNEVDGIQSTLAELAGVVGPVGGEIVVVDDGSTDGTAAVLDELERTTAVPGLRVVHNERNLGYGAAIKTGVRRALADLIVIIDADGTYPCNRIPELVGAAHDADMVVGARPVGGEGQPFLRRIAKGILRAHCSWLVGQRIPDMNSGLRVFRKHIFDRYFKILPDGFSLTTTVTVAMMRGRYSVIFVPIGFADRVGRSKIRPVRDTLGFAQLILRTGMYFAPLRVLMPLAAILMLGFSASLAYDVVMLQNLTDKTVILLLFGMNTALFGLLADMIDKRS
jgi:glycosyltransferase involved in cell wall biosynthesis